MYITIVYAHYKKLLQWITVSPINCLLLSVLLLQVHDLEFAQIEVQVVQGLKDGNAALKKMHQVRILCLDEVGTSLTNYFLWIFLYSCYHFL